MASSIRNVEDQAWVTLATNDTYALGALVLAHSLIRVGTSRKLVVLVTPGISAAMRSHLGSVFDVVKEVNVLDSSDTENLTLLSRPDLGVTFTKLHCWRLTQYKKCVFMDADTLVLQNCDELFDREELSAAPDVGWPDCFNSGVFVYQPSDETYRALIQCALSTGSFDGGDQGLLNVFFRDWATKDIAKHLPFIYNMTSSVAYTYLPAYQHFAKDVRVVHFIGPIKPWNHFYNTATSKVEQHPGAFHSLSHLQFWWDIFVQDVQPNLQPELAGLAAYLSQLAIGSGDAVDPKLLDDRARQFAWEQGHIDYLGVDSFDNIQRKLDQSLASDVSASQPAVAAETAPPPSSEVQIPTASESAIPAEVTELPKATEPLVASVALAKGAPVQTPVVSDARPVSVSTPLWEGPATYTSEIHTEPSHVGGVAVRSSVTSTAVIPADSVQSILPSTPPVIPLPPPPVSPLTPGSADAVPLIPACVPSPVTDAPATQPAALLASAGAPISPPVAPSTPPTVSPLPALPATTASHGQPPPQPVVPATSPAPPPPPPPPPPVLPTTPPAVPVAPVLPKVPKTPPTSALPTLPSSPVAPVPPVPSRVPSSPPVAPEAPSSPLQASPKQPEVKAAGADTKVEEPGAIAAGGDDTQKAKKPAAPPPPPQAKQTPAAPVRKGEKSKPSKK